MDGIGAIIALITIISLIEKFSKQSKKKQSRQTAASKDAAAAKPARMPPQTKTAAAPQVRAAAAKAKAAEAQTKAAEAAAKTEAAVKKAASEWLKMPTLQKAPLEKPELQRPTAMDAEGCIGGSIAHTRHEGESRAEHAAHMKRAAQPAPVQRAPRLNAADLRRAVVMSEILDKPVSMRGRRPL